MSFKMLIFILILKLWNFEVKFSIFSLQAIGNTKKIGHENGLII